METKRRPYNANENDANAVASLSSDFVLFSFCAPTIRDVGHHRFNDFNLNEAKTVIRLRKKLWKNEHCVKRPTVGE